MPTRTLLSQEWRQSGGQGVCFMCTAFGNSTTAVARLHEKIITPNLLRKLHPLGKHSIPACGAGGTHCWMAGLEEIN